VVSRLGRGARPCEVVVVGIDLAWGDRRPDGVCVARWAGGHAAVDAPALTWGDDALLASVAAAAPAPRAALLAIDAPIVCPNATGSRPVDRQMHRLFHREHAGCHPANGTRCPRPARVLERLAAEQGFAAGTRLAGRYRLAAEVYPHPALCRLLRLERIVKYKRGPVAARRGEFRRLQWLLGRVLRAELAWVARPVALDALLRTPWSKAVEDRTDALVCALVGLWHVHHAGRRSEVIGDVDTGFILLPEDLRRLPARRAPRR
jgi:predicted RNase H-like nuclease